jgi:hypothetical protein
MPGRGTSKNPNTGKSASSPTSKERAGRGAILRTSSMVHAIRYTIYHSKQKDKHFKQQDIISLGSTRQWKHGAFKEGPGIPSGMRQYNLGPPDQLLALLRFVDWYLAP